MHFDRHHHPIDRQPEALVVLRRLNEMRLVFGVGSEETQEMEDLLDSLDARGGYKRWRRPRDTRVLQHGEPTR